MSYTEQLQNLVQRYINSSQPWPASAKDIAAWAIDSGFWEPSRSTALKQCAHEIAQAMREEYFTDPQGRNVRAKHALLIERAGEQTALWADMRTDDHEHIEAAFQQRRQHIVGECRQLKTDVDSYNENFNAGEPIQMIFDFTLDLEEIEALNNALS